MKPSPRYPPSWRTRISGVLRDLGGRYPELRRLRQTATGDRLWRLVSDTRPAPAEHEGHSTGRALERRRQYAATLEPGLLSFITTVWNTEPRYLAELAESVFSQDAGASFEWVILDNGSQAPATVRTLESLGSHPCVRLQRVPSNLGIVGGMRLCLERARGEYVLPLDSDDWLSPDCARVVTWFLQRNEYPPLLYTDEDKLSGTVHRDAYFKPDWDPVLFVNSCYIAHLCAVQRRLALELGAYDDPGAEGCHDWDTFMRFLRAGHTPVHVPEVLYTWRMHQGSTSGNIGAKPFVYASHRRVLEAFLEMQPVPDLYRVDGSPLFQGTPDWWIRRRHERPRPLTTVLLKGREAAPALASWKLDYPEHEVAALFGDDPPSTLRPLAERAAERGGLIHLLWDKAVPNGDEWPWEVVALMELFPDTAIVGGRVADAGGTILAAGCYFGFGRGCDSPDRGRSVHDPGYFAQMWKQHTVSAVSSQHMVVDGAFLCTLLDDVEGTRATIPYLGAWAGSSARHRGRRVVYTPFMLAHAAADWDALVSDEERAAFLSEHRGLIPETEVLSPSLGLDPAAAYRAVPPSRRELHLERLLGAAPDTAVPERGAPAPRADSSSLPSYAEWLRLRVARRAEQYPIPRVPPRLTLLTSVYEGTDAALFRATGACLLAQSAPFHEWVVLAHGPISRTLEGHLRELGAHPRVRVIRRPTNLGIAGAMRVCLGAATGDYVMPVDADDLLTDDALQVLSSVIDQRGGPGFLYSDEDILTDGVLMAPYWRPDWDPVLNLSSSYIWHLCAFRRTLAVDLGVYGDGCPEWCHDWDTVFRFADAGHEPVHVPEVLYHWRRHAGSSTNRVDPESGSLGSVRQVLERRVATLPHPERYEVRPFPVFRGAPDWRIRRKRVDPPTIDVIVLGTAKGLPERAAAHLRRTVRFPFASVRPCLGAGGEDGSPYAGPPRARDLAAVLQESRAELVLVISEMLRAEGDGWVWEAIRLFECHPDVALACGRVADRSGIIVAGPQVLDGLDEPRCLEVGRHVDDPGPFALALKPHSVDGVPMDLFFGETVFLRAALGDGGPHVELAGLGARLARHAHAAGRRVAFSPLIGAVAAGGLMDPPVAGGFRPPAPVEKRTRPLLSSARFVEAQELYRMA